MTSKSVEMSDIVLAKGIGVFLVVVGHLVPAGHLTGNDWFFVIKNIIYMFHMPFFMALSGYLFIRNDRLAELYKSYFPYVKGQFLRLILPFFVMGVLVLLGKMAAQQFIHVDKVPEGFLVGLKGLFYETWRSPALFIWYIYVLFVYKAVSLALYKVAGYRHLPVFAVGLVLYFMPSVTYFYLDKLMPFFVFFVYGGILRDHKDQYLAVIDRFGWCFCVVFAAALFFLYDPSLPEYTHVKLIAGGLSVPAIHFLCRVIMRAKNILYKVIYVLGSRSYAIYLFNTICIGLTKAVMFMVMSWNGMNFLVFAPILICGGIIGPIIISEIYALRFKLYARFRGAM